jgi:hypothetical protein
MSLAAYCGFATLSEAIPVTVSTARDALAGLPLTARLTLLFAARLRRGTLEVSLPNGRRLRFGGVEPGPAAMMIINDLGFGRRFIAGGDIGIAEAYMHGEWETRISPGSCCCSVSITTLSRPCWNTDRSYGCGSGCAT